MAAFLGRPLADLRAYARAKYPDTFSLNRNLVLIATHFDRSGHLRLLIGLDRGERRSSRTTRGVVRKVLNPRCLPTEGRGMVRFYDGLTRRNGHLAAWEDGWIIDPVDGQRHMLSAYREQNVFNVIDYYTIDEES
jgi:hypothetical protein